jgi:hypothetical protein
MGGAEELSIELGFIYRSREFLCFAAARDGSENRSFIIMDGLVIDRMRQKRTAAKFVGIL